MGTLNDSSHALPELITSTKDLQKRDLDYWVLHACNRFLDIFASTSTPPTFQIASESLDLQGPHDISGSQSSGSQSSNLLHQAQMFDKATDQMHVALNIAYAAWALKGIIEGRDHFLMSITCSCLSVVLSDRLIRTCKFGWTMGTMG